VKAVPGPCRSTLATKLSTTPGRDFSATDGDAACGWNKSESRSQ
jgi:hypothetical protein